VKPVLLAFQLPVLGEIVFPAYFTLLTIGFGLAMVLTVRESKKLGMDHERVLDTNLWMVVWGIIGARVLHLIADGHFQDYVNMCVDPKLVPAIDAKVAWCADAKQCGYDYLCDLVTHKCYPPKDCLMVFKVWRGGLAYYGGFLAAVPFAWYYVRKHALGWWRTADLAAPGIMLGLFFGRMGCYLNGCCYGKVTDGPLGVVFLRDGATWRAQLDAHLIQAHQDALPVHPTQLYEAMGCFLAFAILYYVVRPRRRAFGQVFAWMLILYAIARSIVEIWRDDDRGVFFGGYLSTSQLISLPLAAAGVYLLLVHLKRKPA
jgi:phosphatidylglycerol---prolipoprotein diacylglyceryl transferase